MKKALKITMIYLGVILLALLATIIFCAGFLFFCRDANIFGVKYINTNQIIYAREDGDMSGLETIEINSKDFPVNIVLNSNVQSVSGAMRNNVYGYLRQSKAVASYSLNYNSATKTAVFNGSEPSGFLNKSDSYIEIAIPKSDVAKGYNIVVKTSKGDVTINNGDLWTLGKVEINSSKGDVQIGNVRFTDEVNFDIGSGKVNVLNNCESQNEVRFNVGVTSGEINLFDINADKLVIGELNVVKNKRGKVVVKSIWKLTSENVVQGGKIQVETVNFIDFECLDTHMQIINLESRDGLGKNDQSRIKVTGQGIVEISNAKDGALLDISGHNGDIVIKESARPLKISSNKGDIAVEKAILQVDAVSVSGNINIAFNSSAWDCTVADANNNKAARFVTATTESGDIKVIGLQRGIITATGKGEISLNYNKVVGENLIKSNSGAINIIVPATPENSGGSGAVSLTLDTGSNADVEVGVVKWHSYGLKTFTNIYNETSVSTSNNLNITSKTGIVKIRSADLA